MIDTTTLKEAPVPILNSKGEVDFTQSAIVYWLATLNGDCYFLEWWSNGWVISVQSSYLLKDGSFAHKDDIASFAHSKVGKNWPHVFKTKDIAIELFKQFHYNPLCKHPK